MKNQVTKCGVIFDCDGTLVDSLGFALESMNHALASVDGAPRTIDEIKRYFGRSADRIFYGLLNDEKRAAQAFECYLEHQKILAQKVELFPGIRELLQKLHDQDIPMAIVTGRHERDLAIVLERHQIHTYFVTQIADNHVPASKPAPDGILLAASRIKVNPAHAYYVGDSVMDLQAAHAAGSKSVAALWDPLADRPGLHRESPLHAFEHPRELLSVLVDA